MTAKPVEAVFFWRGEGISVFKASYGRKPKKPDGKAGSYTKDFHQPRNQLARALERSLGIAEGGETRVEWRWPGGSYPDGLLKPAADFDEPGGRLNLRWETDSAPPPWRLTPAPDATTLSTLVGQPDLVTEAGADAQLAALVASGERPWLIAVHLHGEGPVLHARVVLEDPKPGREFATWENLPAVVRSSIKALGANKPGGVQSFNEGASMPENEVVSQILEAFRDTPNVLLVGPPGTGKTVALDLVRRMYEPGALTETVTFDPDLLHAAFGVATIGEAGEPRVESLVFHPSYAYEHFVMGLIPDVDGDKMRIRPKVGPLLELAHFASEPDRRALLVLDEFNRGAASAIFGDTLALLDKDKRSEPGDKTSGAKVATPYANLNPQTASKEALGNEISLPKSLRILAAMNSADRSVAPLDAALRRRFAIIYVGPDYDVLSEHLILADAMDETDSTTWTTPGHVGSLAVAILKSLNTRVEFILGRDFLLGQSVMWDVGGTDKKDALDSLAAALDNRVMGTLSLTFTDNDDAFAAALNVTDPPQQHAAARWVEPPANLTGVGMRRLHPVRFQSLDEETLIATLKSLL